MGVKPIDKIRIHHGGEPLKGRVLKISSSIESFETPTRIPTSTELNAKIRIHLDEPWDNQVFEVTNRFNNIEQVQRLHRKNGAFSQKRREPDHYADPQSKQKNSVFGDYHPKNRDCPAQNLRGWYWFRLESPNNLCDISNNKDESVS